MMLTLVRYGGLSYKKQKHFVKNEHEKTFHNPPERYGIYAFLYPYINWYLLGGSRNTNNDTRFKSELSGFEWSDYEDRNYIAFKNKHDSLTPQSFYRKFKVDGYVWTHLYHEKMFRHVVDEKGSWYKIHSSYMHELLSRERLSVHKTVKNDMGIHEHTNLTGKGFLCHSVDHLEIFIPKYTKIKG